MIIFLLLLILNIGINIWGIYTMYSHFQGGFWLFFIAYLASSLRFTFRD